MRVWEWVHSRKRPATSCGFRDRACCCTYFVRFILTLGRQDKLELAFKLNWNFNWLANLFIWLHAIFPVNLPDQFIAAEGADKNQQRAARQVEIG